MPTSRRRLLQTLASAAVAAPLGAQHAHQAAKDFVQISHSAADYKLKFFTKPEFETVRILADLIIPRTDTPGAADAGVHRIIDLDVFEKPELQKLWREGIAWFRTVPQKQQLEVLRAASEDPDHAGAPFFTLLKGAVVDAYYTTKEGLRTELGWNANTFLPEFKGCTHKEHQG